MYLGDFGWDFCFVGVAVNPSLSATEACFAFTMRLVPQTAIATLLAANVLGHSHTSSPRSLQKRTVDLNAYKLGVGASYTNNVMIEEQQPTFRAFTKPTYVDTATTLVRSKFPNAEFRLVSNYVSGNGVGHVTFKQTVHGIDIDTADVNVNVGAVK